MFYYMIGLRASPTITLSYAQHEKKLSILGMERLFEPLLLVATKNQPISPQIRGEIQLPQYTGTQPSYHERDFFPSVQAPLHSSHCRSRRCATAHMLDPTSRDKGCHR
jgi:hypothetical protein